jgi:hypothetical protein
VCCAATERHQLVDEATQTGRFFALGEEVGTVRKLVWTGESYRDLARNV